MTNMTERQRLEEPIEALSANRDHTMLVVAGRQILKVYSTCVDDEFTELFNLRIGPNRRLNLKYSASSVAWSPVQDNTIATASTNGCIVIWKLDKISKDKIEKVYRAHSRAATKVCFHRSDPNMLISGSKDAWIYLYDLRSDSFAQSFFSGGSGDSIRDMQFGLHSDQQDMFVAADDSGHVRFWDMRRSDRPFKQFPAHQNQCASIDLHPNYTEKNLLATGGGRDKFIRVWDWSKNQIEKPIYMIETLSSVAQVYWRPQKTWHIASCSVINDVAIHVWDIRRPFIPFASFEEHRDVTTGIL